MVLPDRLALPCSLQAPRPVSHPRFFERSILVAKGCSSTCAAYPSPPCPHSRMMTPNQTPDPGLSSNQTPGCIPHDYRLLLYKGAGLRPPNAGAPTSCKAPSPGENAPAQRAQTQRWVVISLFSHHVSCYRPLGDKKRCLCASRTGEWHRGATFTRATGSRKPAGLWCAPFARETDGRTGSPSLTVPQ